MTEKRVGFLGCGKIGGSMLHSVLERGIHSVSFVQDPAFQKTPEMNFPVCTVADEALLQKTDLVVESATAAVLEKNICEILPHCNLLVFSVTAFSNPDFDALAKALCTEYGTHIYLPHGAILGLDGIADARSILNKVTIETVKNPATLGRTDTERTLVYEGSTRKACALYPRNVNVHAAVALAGLGFDETCSRIVCDPAVTTNTHHICVEGQGIHFELMVQSLATGGVTGAYTPVSACGSLERVLGGAEGFLFV